MVLTSFKHLAWVGCLVAGLALAPQSQAASVYGTAADLTGTRTEPTEILAFGNWAGAPLSSLSWEIASLGGGLWSYEYTFSSDFAPPEISHFILDLTDDCLTAAGCVTGANGNIEIGSFDGTNPSNPGMPSGIIGVKFDDGGTFFSFTSNRAPVWGDFYIKGGNDSYAYNAGLGNRFDGDTSANFIARPNGTGGGGDIPDVPEPSTVLLMGGSLLALGYFRKKRNS